MNQKIEVKEFAALEAMYSNPNTTKGELMAYFGKAISKQADVEYYHARGTEIIQQCKVWIQNWTNVLEGIKPKIEQRRNEKLEATADKFKDYTPEQLEALVEAIKKKQAI